MLTPEYLQGLPEELTALTEDLEKKLLEDIARRVSKAGMITDTAAYQIMRLKEIGASTEYIEKLIADYTHLSEAAIERMVFDAAQTDSEFYRTVYARTGRNYVPYEYNPYLQQLAVAAVNQTKGELKNLTQSMGFAVRGSDGRLTFSSTAKAYQTAMDKAHMLVATGGMDYITAVRMAVSDLTASGLYFVDYASGVRNHADVAARRAILTGVSQMTGKIAEHNAAELGTDVVEVDAHAGARPDHALWQGKWFSLTGKDKRYPLLSAATGYGTVTGLKGANCRHDFYPVIPGIDEPAYTEEELRNIDPPPVKIDGKVYTYYEAEQRQRAMERAIRKTKRELIAAQGSGDTDMFTAKSVKLKRQREQYSEFSKKAGLLTRNERNQVAGFGHSEASKSAWAAKKATAPKPAKTTKGGSPGSSGSGGHAVTVNVSPPSSNGGTGKTYQKQDLTNSKNSGMINTEDVAKLEQAKMRDHKIMINDVAISKTSAPYIPILSDKQNKKFSELHKDLLFQSMTNNNSNETAFLFDPVTMKYVMEFGEENSVNIFNNPEAYSMATNGKHTSLFLLHNHPSTKMFSYSDIGVLLLNDNIQGITVVTNSGEVYCLLKTEKYSYNSAFKVLSDIRKDYDVDVPNAREDAEIVKRFIKASKKTGIILL